MESIINIIKSIGKRDLPKHLGRWRIENCSKQTINKIDLSNEDHCGTCGQYALEKIIRSEKIKNNTHSHLEKK